MHARHQGERVPAHQASDAALVLGLELVVELLGDAFAHLCQERLGVESGSEPLDEWQQQRRVAQVRLDGLRHTRVLDLHGHVGAVERDGAMHLADRGRGESLLVEIAEGLRERATELLAHHLLEVGEADRGNVVAQRGQAALQLVAFVLRKAVELEHRDHLADLHCRAAHLAKLIDELSHQRSRPLAFRRRRALGRPDPVGGAHPRPAQPLAGHQAADACGARQPAGGKFSRLGRIFGAVTHPPSLAASIPRDGGLAGRRRHLSRGDARATAARMAA